MQSWPKHPLIYEINTWVWLDELSRREQRSLTLASVPDAEWDHIAALGFDAVWLMGVWERSPEGIRISMANDGLLADFRRALPDFTDRGQRGLPLLCAPLRGRLVTWEVPRAWPLPERSWPSGGCA